MASTTPRTSKQMKDFVNQVIKFNESKNYKLNKADPKENMERALAEIAISKKAHEQMRKAQHELIYGSGRKTKKTTKTNTKQVKPKSKPKKSVKK